MPSRPPSRESYPKLLERERRALPSTAPPAAWRQDTPSTEWKQEERKSRVEERASASAEKEASAGAVEEVEEEEEEQEEGGRDREKEGGTTEGWENEEAIEAGRGRNSSWPME